MDAAHDTLRRLVAAAQDMVRMRGDAREDTEHTSPRRLWRRNETISTPDITIETKENAPEGMIDDLPVRPHRRGIRDRARLDRRCLLGRRLRKRRRVLHERRHGHSRPRDVWIHLCSSRYRWASSLRVGDKYRLPGSWRPESRLRRLSQGCTMIYKCIYTPRTRVPASWSAARSS